MLVRMDWQVKVGILRDLLLEEAIAAYQLVGGVRPTKATTGSRFERMICHTGTETLPRLLREAAVENLPQWAKA